MALRQRKDWREALRDLLIDAGTVGLTQRAIVKWFDQRYYTEARAEELENQLRGWENLEMVQSFQVYTTKRARKPATVWRATTKIYQDD